MAVMTEQSNLAKLLEYINERHPRSVIGVKEAQSVDPSRFERIAEMYLQWAIEARGAEGIAKCADAFARFSASVNLAQARYEKSGHYEHKTYAQCYDTVYADTSMADYLWGVYLTTFLWAHHFELNLMYEDRFLDYLPDDVELVEIAPGHGGWGIWALHALPKATLRGYDISPSSIEIASSIADAAGMTERASYFEQDGLALPTETIESADACICCFLVEHLEEPQRLFASIKRVLRPGARAFVTGALTAAQVDHIYEFRRESELLRLAEDSGLRVVESRSAVPRRALRNATFVPRSMAMIVENKLPKRW